MITIFEETMKAQNATCEQLAQDIVKDLLDKTMGKLVTGPESAEDRQKKIMLATLTAHRVVDKLSVLGCKDVPAGTKLGERLEGCCGAITTETNRELFLAHCTAGEFNRTMSAVCRWGASLIP